jgi:hypothetical protein
LPTGDTYDNEQSLNQWKTYHHTVRFIYMKKRYKQVVYLNYGDNEEKKRGKNEEEENEAPKTEPLEQADRCKPIPRCHPGTHYTVPLCHPGTVT